MRPALAVVILTVLVCVVAGAARAEPDPRGAGRSVVFHFLLREPPAVPAPATVGRYDGRARASEPVVGLWSPPKRQELHGQYLEQLEDRRAEEAVPLFVMEW